MTEVAGGNLSDPRAELAAASSQAGGGAAPRRRRRFGFGAFLLFIGPWLFGAVAFTLGPILVSLYFSFTDYSLLRPPEWIGLENYRQMMRDPIFWLAVRNTLLYVLYSVPLKLAVGLGVAVLLNEKLWGLTFYRSALYVPSLLGASVAVADGPNWVADPRYALLTLALLPIWQFGSAMLIFLAGLQQIPRQLLEAAEMDGASRWRRYWHITLPLLSPIILFNLVMQTIGSFQTFSQAYIISGPANSTLLYSVYLYQQGFGRFDMGYASAMAWLLLLAIAVVTGANFLLARYWVHYDDIRN